jgi:hypothetical protein
MADVKVRSAVPEDASAIASMLYASFVEFRPLYTPQGFAATAITAEEVSVRLSEGPVWVALGKDSLCGTVAAVARGQRYMYVAWLCFQACEARVSVRRF